MNAVVEALRAELRARAPFIERGVAPPSGVPELDALTQGLPLGAVTVLSGPLGTGGTRIAARILAARSRAGAPVAWIDGAETLYPPALAAEGVELQRLLVVRRADARAVHAFEQILESGLFSAVVATGLDRWLGPPEMRRIQRAAETGQKLALAVLSPSVARRFDGAALRVGLRGYGPAGALEMELEKDRRGAPPGRTAQIARSDDSR